MACVGLYTPFSRGTLPNPKVYVPETLVVCDVVITWQDPIQKALKFVGEQQMHSYTQQEMLGSAQTWFNRVQVRHIGKCLSIIYIYYIYYIIYVYALVHVHV